MSKRIYELIVENGASGGKPVEVQVFANNIVIDGKIHVARAAGSGIWGAIEGDLDDQADLKAVLDGMQDDIDSKYVKPSGGIPKTDLAEGVKTSLGLADTSLQPSVIYDGIDQEYTNKVPTVKQAKLLGDRVSAIEGKVPSAASTVNQLADKNFVNSSIATETANYISDNGDPFTSVAALQAYSGTVTNNDYAFVTGTDAEGNTYYDRYKATVSGGTTTWAKEYRLNNSSFTSDQWAAINSMITSALVSSYSSHLVDGTKHLTDAQLKAAVTGATDYDPAKVDGYAKNDTCYYNKGLKRAKEAIAGPPGAFDDTEWDDITIEFLLQNSGNDVSLSVDYGKLCVTFDVDDYSTSVDYEVGDFCIRSGLVMVCIEDTSGTWDASDWESYFEDYDTTDHYFEGDIVVYSGAMKICTTDTPNPAGAYDSDYWEAYTGEEE